MIMCISLPPFSITIARIRVPFVRAGAIPQANGKETITPDGSRQYPQRKDARLRGAIGHRVHINRFVLDSERSHGERSPYCLSHRTEARREFGELVEGE